MYTVFSVAYTMSELALTVVFLGTSDYIVQIVIAVNFSGVTLGGG